MWPLCFQLLIQKIAVAHFFLPANSHVHCCRLDSICPSVPESFSLGLFAGSQLLRGRATRARVYFSALGPCISRSCGQQPTTHSCWHCCVAHVCPLWHVLLMAVRWLKLCCGFFQGLILFQGRCSPDIRSGRKCAQICASLRRASSGKCQLTSTAVLPGEKDQWKDLV